MAAQALGTFALQAEPIDSRKSGGVQDEEQEAQETVSRGLVLEGVGEQFAGVSGAWSGSLILAIRKPAAVKTSIIAGSGRCQVVSTKLRPLAVVISSVHW